MINFKGVIDTTLRDGQQSPVLFDTHKYRFSLEEKKLLVEGLIKLGVSHLEFFSPVVSEIEKEDLIELRRHIRSLSEGKKVFLLAHCRCHMNDIEQALDLGFDGLNLYMGVSKYAQNHNYGRNLKEIQNSIKQVIIAVRKRHPNLYLRFSIEDSFRTSPKEIFKVYDEIYPYVNTFGMPDTVGTATPALVEERVKALKDRYPKANLECHFHNDRGYSLINAITAICAGAEYIDTAVWGLSERSGITSLTGLLVNLFFTQKDLCKRFNLELCYPLNVLMGSILNAQVPFTEPVSLTNRTHLAGVHQKAVINNHKTYEAHNLEKFGVNQNQILLGALSGWNSIFYYLKEIEGYELSKDQAKEIAGEYKKQIKRIKKRFGPEKLLREIIKRYPLVKVITPQQYEEKRQEDLSS